MRAATTRLVTRTASEAFGLGALLVAAVRAGWQERRIGGFLVGAASRRQVYFTAVQALPLITLSAVAIGAVIFSEALTLLPKWGAGGSVPRLSMYMTVGQVAPLLSALILVARSGTAIAAELATMRLTREMDLLDAIGANPHHLLVLPRLVGMTVSSVALALWFALFSVLGGYTVTRFLPRATVYPFERFLEALAPGDIGALVAKAALFGLGTALIACAHGLSAGTAARDVPIAATRSVVSALAFCVVANAILTIYVLGR
ncbi:MAG: ABC transporter permease [Planctomycetales bacterium]|nr:ABC transporter permease [Planctomycetales bacterium]